MRPALEGAEPSVTDNPAPRYLVVSHENWYANPGLESLLAWHHKRGVPVRLIHKAGWIAREIRDSIRAEYSRHDPPELQYILLVGEYGETPMYSLGGVGRTDYYYADIEPTSPDNRPEVGVARLSPASATDLANQCRKILDYRRHPPADSNWTEYYVLLSDSIGSGPGTMRGIYHMPQPWYRHDFDTLFGVCPESLKARIDRGTGALMYAGNGDIDRWTLNGRMGWSWFTSDIASLNNDGMTPVVFSMTSLTGDIYQPTCLAEAWMRKYPGGAVACYGATQASYTRPNAGMCSTAVRCVGDTWTISIPGVRDYRNPVFDLGGIMKNVAAYVARYWPQVPYTDNIYMFLMLGDPAMEVWSGGPPQIPTVEYPNVVPLGPCTLEVTVRVNGYSVDDALVCAWKPGEFYSTGRTALSGQAGLSIDAQTPGQFLVTVSSGHAAARPHTPILPFEGTCIANSVNVDEEVRRRSVAAVAAGPNPFRDFVTLHCDGAAPFGARAALRICAADGRLVRNLVVRSPCAGRPVNIIWDGTDDSGRKLPAGVYLVQDCGPGTRSVRTLVKN